MPPTQPRPRQEWGIALGLLGLAALLRLGSLGLHGLWLDEATTLQFASHDLRGCLYAEVNNPPLHRLLVWAWVRFVGDGSDAWVRLPDALFGLLACLVAWRLARRVLPAGAALVALGLLALNPYHLLLSQEVRPYSLLLLLSTLSLWLHLRSLDGESRGWGRRWSGPALLAALVAGLHTHYQFAWVALAIGGHRLYLMVRLLRDRSAGSAGVVRESFRLLYPVAAAALFCLPWIQVVLGEVGPQHRGYTTDLLGRLVTLPFMLLLGESGVVREYPETPGEAALRQVWVLVPFALALAPLLVLGLGRLWRSGAEARFLLLAAALPLLGLAALFPWLPLFTARYLSLLIPVLCILVAAGITGSTWLRLGRIALLVLFALQVLSLGRYHLDPRFGREDWRGAAAWVKARERPGDQILFDHHYVRIPFDRYHAGPAAKLGVPGDASGRAAFFARLLAGQPLRVFVVLSHHWDTGREPLQRLGQVLCLRDSMIFPRSNGIEVHLYERCARH